MRSTGLPTLLHLLFITTITMVTVPRTHSVAVPRTQNWPIRTMVKRQLAACGGNYGGLSATDCSAAADQITSGDDFHDNYERHFYTDLSDWIFDPATLYGSVSIAGPGKTWSSGECSITLWAPDGRKDDLASYQDIKNAAQDIIDACVTPDRVGGRTPIGRYGPDLQVVIYQDSEDDDKTSDTDPTQGTCPLQKAEARQDVADCFLGGIVDTGSGN